MEITNNETNPYAQQKVVPDWINTVKNNDITANSGRP
jgi:hypothetical protein